MKKIFYLLMLMGMLFATESNAQVSVNINIGSQPLWGPVGYDRADYYYFPDMEVYYSVPRNQFIYLSNGRWIFSSGLPPRFARYDLYRGYKVVINSPTPYLYFKNHKVQYAKYRGWMGKQKAIKFSDDPKYFGVKGHPHGGAPGQGKKVMEGKRDEGKGKGKR